MRKIRVLILRNELDHDHELWIKSCEEFKHRLIYRIVNLTSNHWLEEIQKKPFDCLLAKPGGLTSLYKALYDERIFILSYVLRYKIFPSPQEIFIYENKRFLSYWLKANNISHPATHVFYDSKEAQEHIEGVKFPYIAKTNIGASGSGVKILASRSEALKYIHDTFSGKGSPQRTGPNFERGGILNRGLHYVFHPPDITKKLNIYLTKSLNFQKGNVIFQEYVPHEFEWRVIRIGDSFFAHKKIKSGNKASGTLIKEYVNPPLNILNFVRRITDEHRFYSQAIDIFESNHGYLINEMQCIFGQSDPYQMLVNGVPGRYRYIENEWKFEEGDYTRNQCFNLRLEFVLNNLF